MQSGLVKTVRIELNKTYFYITKHKIYRTINFCKIIVPIFLHTCFGTHDNLKCFSLTLLVIYLSHIVRTQLVELNNTYTYCSTIFFRAQLIELFVGDAAYDFCLLHNNFLNLFYQGNNN